ncbi:hypothetical protein [Niallia sp. MER 6]|uniref:hypothetical protein n=1 Tax=Niallia sp. MER 6 TaxID=2939567 RepID=UPI00204013FC|nr:hypothetical protein [Niallia sp. MER 6]MCM3032833.1 hypothetical protein [Niallia sp. MER 6]
MNYTEIYMVESVIDRGTRKSADYIYSVEKHVADELISQGKAREVNYQSLNAHKEGVDKLLKEFEQKITSIKENYRLTPEGKLEEIAALKQATEVKVEEYQNKYEQDLKTLKQAAKRTAGTIELTNNYDADKVRQTVGIIKTEVSMASSFTQAIKAIDEHVMNIDQDSARELLSQFSEIKTMLELKGKKMQARDDISRQATVNSVIRRAYESIKQVSTNESQRNASVEFRMLEAVEKYSGNIRGDFDRIARKYERNII